MICFYQCEDYDIELIIYKIVDIVYNIILFFGVLHENNKKEILHLIPD